jgi:predicted transcriptional regulator
MKAIELPEDYALVLQQVNETGEEDMDTLAEYLRFDRKRLAHIIQALHHKGLISFSKTAYQSSLIRLSAKGKQFISYVWPESGMAPGMSAA